MHFREAGKRIQCLASVYDPERKGPRQVLTWSINTHDPRKLRPTPEQLAAGTEEQRAKWAVEIADYMDERDKRLRKQAVAGSVKVIESMMSIIIEDATSPTPTLTPEEIERIKALAGGWAARLYVREEKPQPVSRPKPSTEGEDPRAFGSDLIEIAKRYRAEGHAIAKTAELMAADGHNVSKSWIQKWTS